MSNDGKQSLRALQAFETAARLKSISKAAEELGVTQGAISHQIRSLSDHVGEKLFVRSGRGIELTPPGEKLAKRLAEAFSQIDRSVSEVIGSGKDTVRLALCSSFAPGWLVPRLQSFYDANPEIQLQLRMYARDPELTDEVADAFITTLPRESGFWSLFLKREVLVSVVGSNHSKGNPLSLITTDHQPGRVGNDWKTYQNISKMKLSVPTGRRNWLFASHYVTALDMVRAGLGAALVPDFLAAPYVEAGTIRLLDKAEIHTGDDYYLCIKEARRAENALDALARWFRGQVT